jgi:hypothetical protein
MFDWNDSRFPPAVTRTGSTLAAARALEVNQTMVARRVDALGRPNLQKPGNLAGAFAPNGR